jgi:transposase
MGFSIDELKTAHPYIAVRTMYENGYSIRQIAQILDRGQGEISLILNLAKRKQACI